MQDNPVAQSLFISNWTVGKPCLQRRDIYDKHQLFDNGKVRRSDELKRYVCQEVTKPQKIRLVLSLRNDIHVCLSKSHNKKELPSRVKREHVCEGLDSNYNEQKNFIGLCLYL